MSREAVVLEDGLIIYLDEISNTQSFELGVTEIVFFGTGRVSKFKANLAVDNEYYMALFSSNDNSFIGYIPEIDFWKLSHPTKRITNQIGEESYKDKIFRDSYLGSTLTITKNTSIDEDTNVVMFKRNLNYSENSITNRVMKFKFKKNKEEYIDYNIIKLNVFNENKILIDGSPINNLDIVNFPGYSQQTNNQELNINLHNYYQSVSQRCFKQPNGDYDFNDTEYTGTTVLDVVCLLHDLYSNTTFMNYLSSNSLLEPFAKHIAIVKDIQLNILSKEHFESAYTIETFSLMRLKLLEFKHWVQGIAFKPTSLFDVYSQPSLQDFIVRVIGLFNPVELSALHYDTKLDFLKRMLKDNYFISGRWWPFYSELKLTEEEVIIKLVQSFTFKYDNNNVIELNYEDINKFMVLLGNPPFYDITDDDKTLLEVLYESVDPDVIFGGAGARGQLMDAIYTIWKNSIFNPKCIVPGFNNFQYSYTDKHAFWKYEDNQISQQDKTIDFEASPRIINYTSEKKWLWYVDNMDFKFQDKKIVALKDGIIPYGYYHIFQPINLLKLHDNESFVSIPIDSSILEETENPCEIEAGRGSNLPLFYLKYIDDIGDKKDTEETIMLTIDVVTTLLGGWGIARRLIAEGVFIAMRNLTTQAISIGITQAVLDLAPLIRANLLRILKTVGISTIEFVLGITSIVHTIVQGNCEVYNDCNNTPPTEGHPDFEAYQRCQSMQKWLFALEILTLSGDLIARKFFKKVTRELRDNLPTNNPYNDISEGDYIDLTNRIDNVISEIENVVDNIDEFINGLPFALRSRIIDPLLSLEKRDAFLHDFRNASSEILQRLAENNGSAFDRWSVLHDLSSIDRLSIDVITNQTLFNKFLFFCSNTNINRLLSKLEYSDRLKFVKKYTTPPFNFTPVIIERIENSPSLFELLSTHMNNPHVSLSNMLDDIDIIDILNQSGLSSLIVDFHIFKISRTLRSSCKVFLKRISYVLMQDIELENFYRGNIGNFIGQNTFNVLSDVIKKKIFDRNKLVTRTIIYSGDTVVSTIYENFVSGKFVVLKRLFGGSLPPWLTDPADSEFFKILKKRAADLNHPRPRIRENDTELKYIYNFLINHWNLGDKFEITIKSSLYICDHCQGSLTYLLEIAKKHGKTINIKVIANKDIKTTDDLINKFGQIN